MTAETGHRADAPTRLEARDKVTGAARYAVEVPTGPVVYAWPVHAAVTKGRINRIDTTDALATPGVLAVLTPQNAPRLDELPDGELMLLQNMAVAYRNQIVALAVAETEELARAGAEAVRIDYESADHDVVLRADHPRRYAPEKVNPAFPTDSIRGDPERELAGATVSIDVTYTTPPLHNNAMEPHATTARWDGERLTLWDSNQGTTSVAGDLATLFGLDPDAVRVYAEHVGGGFGSKGSARPNAVLAALAARKVGRPVRLALTRQAMFRHVGYRTPTIQRVRLGADADGTLRAVTHEVVEQTSTLFEFAEQTAVATRSMYAAPAIATSHRLVRLDVPTPRWMRAPGECPGMYALESAMDELAVALGMDPIELRIANEPARDPESGQDFSSRNLVACLRTGAERFGWADRDPTPGTRSDGHWLLGTGVAAAAYPAYTRPAGARAHAYADGRFTVAVNATDIGTGARTVLHQIAVEALAVAPDRVHLHLADSALPPAPVAGGSAGTASWGWAVTQACEQLCELMARQPVPEAGLEVTVDTKEAVAARPKRSRHAYGAQFAEVAVDADTGEVRLRRLVGIFAAGRIINARTARSQLLGGMTMGASMALLEEARTDAALGDVVTHDLATYHVATSADVPRVEADWIAEDDGELNPMGSKGIGEIGIVGTAAAIGNAVYHATGVRVRDLPIRLDRLLGHLPT